MKYENIDIEIRKIQEIEIEILKEFDRVCKKWSVKPKVDTFYIV